MQLTISGRKRASNGRVISTGILRDRLSRYSLSLEISRLYRSSGLKDSFHRYRSDSIRNQPSHKTEPNTENRTAYATGSKKWPSIVPVFDNGQFRTSGLFTGSVDFSTTISSCANPVFSIGSHAVIHVSISPEGNPGNSDVVSHTSWISCVH